MSPRCPVRSEDGDLCHKVEGHDSVHHDLITGARWLSGDAPRFRDVLIQARDALTALALPKSRALTPKEADREIKRRLAIAAIDEALK